MISIPIAVDNEFFKWQLGLFWFAHTKSYGANPEHKALPVIVNSKIASIDRRMRHESVEPYTKYYSGPAVHKLKPLNIQTGIIQMINQLHDDQVVEVIDCDMIHLKKHPVMNPGEALLVSTIYEDWHLKSKSDHSRLVSQFVGTKDYYNGGFVPIIGKVSTIKKILTDWKDYHIKIVETESDELLQWWAGMYALQVACEINKVKMIGVDMLYVPGVNKLKENHYIAHYSVDRFFDKKKIPNMEVLKGIDTSTFPDDHFYKLVTDYIKII